MLRFSQANSSKNKMIYKIVQDVKRRDGETVTLDVLIKEDDKESEGSNGQEMIPIRMILRQMFF